MKTNERYISDVSPELFRDFLLRAAVAGAHLGYDSSGDIWAIVDPSTFPTDLIVSDASSTIYAFSGEKGPTGEFVEWKLMPTILSESFKKNESDRLFCIGGSDSEAELLHVLQNNLDIPGLLYRPGSGWTVDTDDPEWHETPTVPADRIEAIWVEAFCGVAA